MKVKELLMSFDAKTLAAEAVRKTVFPIGLGRQALRATKKKMELDYKKALKTMKELPPAVGEPVSVIYYQVHDDQHRPDERFAPDIFLCSEYAREHYNRDGFDPKTVMRYCVGDLKKCDWKEALGYEVAETSLKRFDWLNVAALIFRYMTWYGRTYTPRTNPDAVVDDTIKANKKYLENKTAKTIWGEADKKELEAKQAAPNDATEAFDEDTVRKLEEVYRMIYD